MATLKEGDKAPGFTLPSSDGGKVSLSDFMGRKHLVLYFYPKDDTPGCTKEACNFRDLRKKFQGINAEIYGVSFDSINSHEKFITKYKLPFPLLSDDDKTVAKKYGVYKEKSFMGRRFMGIERTTFIIGSDLKIKKIFQKVKVDGHAEEVLAAVKFLLK
ncbi:MAG: thioredoxin-dependent thiol peroxidase [Candidatus Omnitrophica bacterium]|nr:thioredoxin-dependent thiol peroxidase [Candidatus Omnitrophota bacterium]